MSLTSTVLDDLSPNGVTRKHLQITNNEKMPKRDKQMSISIGNPASRNNLTFRLGQMLFESRNTVLEIG